MDGIDLLKQQALAKRNAAIMAARREYATAIKENGAGGKFGIRRPGRPRKVVPGNPTLKATTVARAVLSEGKPMGIVELTLEVQRRGCRMQDDPGPWRTPSTAGWGIIPGSFGRMRRGGGARLCSYAIPRSIRLPFAGIVFSSSCRSVAIKLANCSE